MPLWTDNTLFDRTIDLLTQKKKGYVKFNKARDSITDYFRPDLGSDLSSDGDGTFFGDQIYEGTAPWAARVMASGFQGNIASESADWFLYAMGLPELVGIDALDIWVQEVAKYMSSVYRKSNYYTVLNRFVLDGVTIGSPLMFIEEDIPTATIKYLPQYYKNVYIFYDRFNQPEGVMIEDETWTTKKIFDKFAGTMEKAAEKFSTGLMKEIESGHWHSEHTIIRAVFKSTNALWDNVDGFKKPNKPWIDVYFEEGTDQSQKNIPLETSGYFSQPFVVWDIDKKPWESVSRTPAFEAIYDVISSQQVTKAYLENVELKNRSPKKVNPDYRNSIDFSPEGITEVKASDWETAVANIDLVGDVLLNKDLSEVLAVAVKRWFRTDNFIKFTDLTNNLRDMPTATQIIKMAAEIAVQLIPEISTFTGGYLKTQDDRMIEIESRARRGPFARERMEEVIDAIERNTDAQASSLVLTPVFIGQLARAQKVKQELDPILDGIAAIAPLTELYPDLKFAIREYGTAEDILKAVNFPLKNFIPEDEYGEIIAAVTKQRQEQADFERNLEMAKAAPGLSGPVDDESVLSAAAEGAASG